MRRMKSAVPALLVVVTGLLLAPSGASAAVTVGETFVADTPCTSFTTYVQSGSASGQYSMPSDGVITSWSHQAGPAAAGIKFKVLRSAGADDFTLVGESELTTMTAGQLNTLPVRIPVQSGDLIGAFIGVGPKALCGVFTIGDSDNQIRSTVGDVSGSGVGFPDLDGEAKLSFSASLELDSDNDGFGDETQDQCPDDPSTQGACALPARIGKVKVTGPSKLKKGKKATYKVKISNTGGLPASGVKVKVTGKGVKATASAGRIAAGKSKTVKVKLKPKKRGKTTLSFKVTSAKAGVIRIRKGVNIG